MVPLAEDLIRYGELVEAALRAVVREALACAAREGLPGDHHFYITCRTTDPGMEIPNHLRKRYPEEITLVIQHQFWDLEVKETTFAVTLSFGGKRERLRVPLAAVTGFVDPSVEFGLQFKAGEARAAAAPEADVESIAEQDGVEQDDEAPREKVVRLDTFRKS